MPAKLTAASHAAYHHVGIFADAGKLFLRLQPDHGLVEEHVVQHAAQRITRVLRCDRILHRLAYGYAQAPRVIGIPFKERRPAAVSGLGLGTHLPPHVSIIMRR